MNRDQAFAATATMPLLQSSQFIEAIVILGATLTLLKLYKILMAKNPLDNIPGPPPSSRLTGHLMNIKSPDSWKWTHDITTQYHNVVRLGGIFNAPILYVFDPKALHSILVKDQYKYGKTSFGTLTTSLILGPGLLSTAGHSHKMQRKMLNPVFSIKHMRDMTPIFYRVSHLLCEALKRETQAGPKDVNILNWLSRTALELIGQGGLGHSFDPLIEDKQNHFGDALKALVPALESLLLVGPFLRHLVKLGSPSVLRRLVESVPLRNVQALLQITDTMDHECRQIYYERKAALEAGDTAVMHQIAEGKDIMSILMKANMESSGPDRLSEKELLGQMLTLVFAATDTTSSALSRILDLLSQHQVIQDKLREEVVQAINSSGGDIPYDDLVELPYLDAVCRETLRLYAPVPKISRVSSEDMILPLSNPIPGLDGTTMSEILVPKGTLVFVGIMATNRISEFWGEDVLEWKPERWLKPLPESVLEAHIPGVYSNLMTFNGGGRSCIGFKFSQLEMKVVLSLLVSSFKFSPADNSKDLKWNLAGVNYPSLKGAPKQPTMPMKIQLV